MQHIITDEEVNKTYRFFVDHPGNGINAMRAALTDFLNNRPQVAQLRPIAEMSEKPPEGCVRVSVGKNALGDWIACDGEHAGLNFAIDIQLPTPDPDAEERRQFEEAMKKEYPKMDLTRDKSNTGPSYIRDNANCMWIGFQLAKKGGDK